jgi:hypothetical protein
VAVRIIDLFLKTAWEPRSTGRGICDMHMQYFSPAGRRSGGGTRIKNKILNSRMLEFKI